MAPVGHGFFALQHGYYQQPDAAPLLPAPAGGSRPRARAPADDDDGNRHSGPDGNDAMAASPSPAASPAAPRGGSTGKRRPLSPRDSDSDNGVATNDAGEVVFESPRVLKRRKSAAAAPSPVAPRALFPSAAASPAAVVSPAAAVPSSVSIEGEPADPPIPAMEVAHWHGRRAPTRLRTYAPFPL